MDVVFSFHQLVIARKRFADNASKVMFWRFKTISAFRFDGHQSQNPCSHFHCIHWRFIQFVALMLTTMSTANWRFIQFVALMLTTMSTAKRSKSGARQFQKSWTADVGFVCRNDRAVCTLVQDESAKNQGKRQSSLR